MGLQLLLVQPSDGAVLAFRAACLAAGSALPAWLAYKAVREGDAKSKDRSLRLAVALSALQLGEGLLLAPTGLARWRHWPAAKLALLAWLLLDDCEVGGAAGGCQCRRAHGDADGRRRQPRPCSTARGPAPRRLQTAPQGADAVYGRIAAALAPHEEDIDALSSAAAPLASHAAASFLSPIRAAAGSCAAVCLAAYRLGHAHYARRQRLRAVDLDGRGNAGAEAQMPRHPRQAGAQRTSGQSCAQQQQQQQQQQQHPQLQGGPATSRRPARLLPREQEAGEE